MTDAWQCPRCDTQWVPTEHPHDYLCPTCRHIDGLYRQRADEKHSPSVEVPDGKKP